MGLMGIDMEDDGKELPKPETVKITPIKEDYITLVDIDFEAYREALKFLLLHQN